MTDDRRRPSFPGRTRRRAALLAGAFAVTLALTGCGESGRQSEDDHLQAAQELRLKGDLRGSVIELKNALQLNPDSAAARFMLGQIYVDVGDGASAEKELLRARELGIGEDAILKPLGRAWLLQGKYDKLLAEITVDGRAPAATQATALSLRGRAELGTGALADAETSFQRALELVPDSVEALTGLSELALQRRDLKAARAALERAAAIAPADPDVLRVEGDLSFLERDYAESAAAYATLLKTRPNHLVFLTKLARAQIALGELDKAAANLDQVLQIAPNHATVNYLRAIAAYKQRDYDEALKYAQRVLNVDEGHVPALLISGASSYALGRWEQANRYLTVFLAAVPDNDDARKLLGATLLQLKRPQEALSELAPLDRPGEADADSLALIGTAAAQVGDMVAGSQYFRRAIELQPARAALRASLGYTQIALGRADDGIAQLEKAIQQDRSLKRATIMLILNLIGERQYDRAIEEARKLQAAKPKSAAGYTLEGTALLAKQDAEGAEKLFRKALEVAPGDVYASESLAALLLTRGEIAKARTVYKEALKANPGEVDILLRLAELEESVGDRGAARRWLEKALEVDPDNPDIALRLARAYANAGLNDKALAVAGDALRVAPGDAALLEVVGRTQLAAGQARDAVATLQRLAEVEKDSAFAHFMLARAALGARDIERAKEALKRVLELDPGHRGAMIMRTSIALSEGDTATAKTMLERLRAASSDDDPAVLELSARLAGVEGRVADAVTNYGALAEVQPNARNILRYADAAWRAGDADRAIKVLEDWVATHPGDRAVRFKLGEYLIGQQAFEKAKEVYAKLVAEAPNSPVARNNLAWCLWRLGDFEAAWTEIERARVLAPEDPVIQDTAGLILMETGKPAEAARLLRRASERLPGDPVVRLHLAQALAKAGDGDEAREILRDLVSSDVTFEGKDEAVALLETLER